MKSNITCLFLICLLGMATSALAQQGQARDRPNVIVILADDAGWDDVSFNVTAGAPDYRTPNIDSIAEHGVRFTSGYASHPFCSPMRAGLLTGRYQHRFGFETNPVFDPENTDVGIDPDERTLGDVMSEAGYTTGFIGKWHLGAGKPFYPMNRGFDEMFGFRGGGHLYWPEIDANGRVGLFIDEPKYQTDEYFTKLLKNGKRVNEKQYLTKAFSREASSFVKRHADSPFFLYLAYNAPHSPLQAPRSEIKKFDHLDNRKRQIYAAMMSIMDDGIGKILQTLRDEDLYENTLVIFLSDNGAHPLLGGSNEPLSGQKGNLGEGGIRVPFAMQWPAQLPAGKEYHEPVISLDVFATAAGAGRAELPDDRKIDGVNLIPYILGRKNSVPHEKLYWRVGGPNGAGAIRQGKWKLSNPGGNSKLFDLENDVTESNDLSDKYPERVESMKKNWKQWSRELDEPRWPHSISPTPGSAH